MRDDATTWRRWSHWASGVAVLWLAIAAATPAVAQAAFPFFGLPSRGQAAPVAPPPEPMPVVPAPPLRGAWAPRCPASGGGPCVSPFDGMPLFNHQHAPQNLGLQPSCLPPALQPPRRPWALIIPVTAAGGSRKR